MNSFLLGSLFILGGCVANVFFLELLVRYTENSMVLLSFSQFLTTSLWNISEFWQWSGTFPFIGLKERVIPIKNYVFLTVVFFSLSVMNNKALEYDISIPVHTVFRSCSLPVTLIVGTLVFKKRYGILTFMHAERHTYTTVTRNGAWGSIMRDEWLVECEVWSVTCAVWRVACDG